MICDGTGAFCISLAKLHLAKLTCSLILTNKKPDTKMLSGFNLLLIISLLQLLFQGES